MPSDLNLQLMKNPDENYSYADSLIEVQKSYARMFSLKRPSLIFLNYKGLIQDRKTLTHEMGHAR